MMNKKIIALMIGLGIVFSGTGILWTVKNTSAVHAESSTAVKLVAYGDTKTFTKEGEKIIRQELLDPIEKLNGIWQKDAFSRCPSGANYAISSKPTKESPYYLGKVAITTGCSASKEAFHFRVSENGLITEILETKSNKYIPSRDWFKDKKSSKAPSWWKNLFSSGRF